MQGIRQKYRKFRYCPLIGFLQPGSSPDYFTLLQYFFKRKIKLSITETWVPILSTACFFSQPDYKPLKNQHSWYNGNPAYLSNSLSSTNYPFCTQKVEGSRLCAFTASMFAEVASLSAFSFCTKCLRRFQKWQSCLFSINLHCNFSKAALLRTPYSISQCTQSKSNLNLWDELKYHILKSRSKIVNYRSYQLQFLIFPKNSSPFE